MPNNGQPEVCTMCGEPLRTDAVPVGFVYCPNGHMTTVSPLCNIDPSNVATMAELAADFATKQGKAISTDRLAAWKRIEDGALAE